MAVRDEALQAYQNQFTTLRQDAVAALREVLLDSTGTPAVPLSTLTQNLVDLDKRLVVVTDPASAPPVSMAIQDMDGDGVWKVYLVQGAADGGWTRLSGAVSTLGELGRAIDEAGI